MLGYSTREELMVLNLDMEICVDASSATISAKRSKRTIM